MDHLCYICFVFVMLSCLFIAALRSPEGNGLTSWLLFVIFIVLFCFVFVALRPKSTAMVIAGRSVHLTTLFPGQA